MCIYIYICVVCVCVYKRYKHLMHVCTHIDMYEYIHTYMYMYICTHCIFMLRACACSFVSVMCEGDM